MLAQLQDVSVTLGGKTILADASLHLEEGERIGLVGPNGSGKSTLLRLLAKEQKPDEGSIVVRRDVKLGYLPQDIQIDQDVGLLAYLLQSQPGRIELEQALEKATRQLDAVSADGTDSEETLDLAQSVASLHERIAHFEAYFSERSAKRILGGLGFASSDHVRPLTEFSGGWKMRALLGSLLFMQPDLLLLDEPTNHLDMPSVAWLSSFLKQHKKSFMLVSHDAEFLTEQVNRIVSFEPEGIRTYRGNYEHYQEQRAEELEVLRGRVRNIEREKAQTQRFVDRFRAKSTKARQVQSRIKALEKLEDIKLPQERRSLHFKFGAVQKTAREVLRAEDLRHAYGAHTVLSGVNLTLQRGDRVAIVGPNGAGKTTLLRIAAGELEPTDGTVRTGRDVDIAYFAQHHADQLVAQWTLREQVKAFAGDATDGQVRGACGILHFDDMDMDKRVRVLSGGERARVALSKLLLSRSNLFLMDEPTNHLDLGSSQSLIDALNQYEGTLVFVSHNKAFVRALANKLWIVSDGNVTEYPGSFDDYLWSCQERDETPVTEAQAPPPERRAKRGERQGKKREQAIERAKKRSALKPLQKRAKQLETKIAKLEEAKKEQEASLADPALYEDAEAQQEIAKAYARTQAELDVLSETWLEVQEEIEAHS